MYCILHNHEDWQSSVVPRLAHPFALPSSAAVRRHSRLPKKSHRSIAINVFLATKRGEGLGDAPEEFFRDLLEGVVGISGQPRDVPRAQHRDDDREPRGRSCLDGISQFTSEFIVKKRPPIAIAWIVIAKDVHAKRNREPLDHVDEAMESNSPEAVATESFSREWNAIVKIVSR